MAKTSKAKWVPPPSDSDVVLPLSEARAAAETLYELEYGELGGLSGREEGGWLKQWALDALKRSLGEAETGFRKLRAGAP